MKDKTIDQGYRAPAVKRAFKLLMTIARTQDECGLSELAQLLGYGKSTTHGLVQALIDVEALVQIPGRRGFFLGPAISELAFSSWNFFLTSEQAEPYLRALRDETGETVFLGFQSASRVIIIASAEALSTFKISAPAGSSIPLLAGAVGKIFLARKTNEEALKFISRHGLRAFTPHSILKEEDYLAELARVRQAGYALDNEEYLPGVRAAAVSLGNRRGPPMALWLVGFSGSLTEDRQPLTINALQQSALELQTMIDNQGKGETRLFN